MTKFDLTAGLAKRVLDAVDAGLVAGIGEPVPGRMCVEAAVCYALGLPHSDDPGCVAAAVRQLKITLNDSEWPSKEVRAKGLRRLAIAQLGSKGVIDDIEFAKRVAEMTIRAIVPLALRATANPALEAAAVRCEQEGTKEAARAAISDAYAAASTAASTAAASTASTAAAYASTAAAAAYASTAAAYASTAAAAAYASTAEVFFDFAERVVVILRDMGSPGCAYLYLTEESQP